MERGHLRHERAAVTPPPRRSRRSRVWMLQTLGVRAPCVHLTLAGFPALKVKTHNTHAFPKFLRVLTFRRGEGVAGISG